MKTCTMACAAAVLLSLGAYAARAEEKDVNKLFTDDQKAYIQDFKTSGNGPTFRTTIVFKEGGSYRIVYGFRKNNKWHVGGILGTHYFREETVSSGAGVTKVYTFEYTGAQPPANKTVNVEIYPDQ